MARRADFDAASAAVASRHPGFAALVAAHGPVRLGPAPRPARRFEVLARHVAFQQLAGAAARTIWDRVRASAGAGPFEATGVLERGAEPLRAAGLSAAKAATVLDLADHVAAGRIRLDRIGRRADDEIVEELTVVRGIGPWTAQMFLLFDLHRLDVWPTGDLAVRAGYGLITGAPTPSVAQLSAAGDQFRPFRSAAAWYCWRAVHDSRRQDAQR